MERRQLVRTSIKEKMGIKTYNPISIYRRQQRGRAAYSQLESAESRMSKERDEYLDSVEEAGEYDYPGFYTIYDDKIIEREQYADQVQTLESPADLIRSNPELLRERYEQGYYDDYFKSNPKMRAVYDEWYMSDVVAKEEGDYLAAKDAAKAKAMELAPYYKVDMSLYDKEAEDYIKQKELIQAEKHQFIQEAKTEELTYWGEELDKDREEFKSVASTMPLAVGREESVYNEDFNRWFTSNKDFLGRTPTKSTQLITGNIELTEQQKQEAYVLLPEVAQFQTFKGSNSEFTRRLLSKAPQYAFITPAGSPQAIAVPYLTGEYQEFDPMNFEIKTLSGSITRWNRLGEPMVETKLLSSRKLDTSDPFVKMYVIQQNIKRWGYQGNSSQDAADKQRDQIFKKLASTEYKVNRFVPEKTGYSMRTVFKVPIIVPRIGGNIMKII